MKRGNYKKNGEGYKITLNRQKRVYTIRRYSQGKLIAKYRSYPQSREEFSEHWTEGDIKAFLRYSGDYYVVK